MLSVASFLFVACGDSTEEFSNIARTSIEERNDTEVNEYYEQLETAEPNENKDDDTTVPARPIADLQ